MKTKLFTRNIVLGILMTLAMAFSVPGICDPLQITAVSPTTQTKGVLDPPFEIQFSVRLNSDTIAYNDASPRRRVTDANDLAAADSNTIDSSGYVVTYIGNTAYRDVPTGAALTALRPTTGANRLAVTLVSGARPSYTDEANQAAEYTGAYLVDTGGNAVTATDGMPIYIRTRAGTRDDTSTTDVNENAPYRYDRAQGIPANPEPVADRFDYNEEEIRVTVSPASMNINVKGSNYFLTSGTDLTEASGVLRSSMTLVCDATDAGTYTITIEDATESKDYPRGTEGIDYPLGLTEPETTAGLRRSKVVFTLYVTEDSSGGDTTYRILSKGGQRYSRVDTGKAIETVSSQFGIFPATTTTEITDFSSGTTGEDAANLEIRYKVTSGNGTLFVGENTATILEGPATDLTAHRAALVFLNTNRTDNRISASIAGLDHQTFPATIEFEYTGTDRQTANTPTPPTPPTTPTTQPPVTTLSVASSLSGAPGSTQTLQITSSELPTVGSLTDTFRTAGGTAAPVTGTRPLYTTTLTLPSTAGSYNLSIFAGTRTQTVRVTVTGTPSPQTSGSLRIDVPLSGAAGSQQTATVTATNSSGNRVEDVVITLGVTTGGGTFSPARVTTEVNGTARSILTRGTTAGTNYFITANAQGYPEYRTRIVITDTPQRTEGTPTSTQTTDTRTTDTPPASAAGDPNLISIDGEATRSGAINQELDAPLVVEVLDSRGERVSNARVVFRVQTGQGRLSQRGNGRAVATETNARGLARADYTPMSARSTVEASVRGVTEAATFTIITDGSAPPAGTSDSATRSYEVRDQIPISLEGTLNFSSPRTLNGITYTCVGPGECVVSYGIVAKGQIQAAPAQAPPQREYEVRDQIPISLEDTLIFTGQHAVNGTIYTCVGPGECVVSYGIVSKGQIRAAAASTTPTRSTTEINPEVLIGAANRPPMLWVDGGKIYALVGAQVQEFISGVEGALNIAIGGDKIYWTERTGQSAGTINRANLDGSDAKQLKAIQAIPMGIAVDTANSKLYWTNSRGRIQSANLDGSGIRNVIQGSPNRLIDLSLSSNNLYFTQSDESGPIGRLYPTLSGDQMAFWNSGSMSGTPGSLAIANGKVYWTAKTSESTGAINSVNLNGSGAKQLASIQAVPMGIAVDTARSKLFWTNSRGRIQSANLDGSRIQNVVDGLGMPGDMVISNSIKAPTATPAKSTTTAAKGKYDLNGDGTVDNTDVDALIVAISGGVTSAKYDVNGDGKVDFNDIVAVRANRSGGAASAPTLLGRKFSALEVDRLQEQIDLLIATGDRSPAAMQTLIYLQQLIAMARPEKTQLLANFPNPFNPETWMPYELATDTDVRITIYNAQGVVIRTLQLGQQSAGYYTDRERAAHWDGRNALGEQVASGIYFYQLETDEMSSLRKMVILK